MLLYATHPEYIRMPAWLRLLQVPVVAEIGEVTGLGPQLCVIYVPDCLKYDLIGVDDVPLAAIFDAGE